MTRKRYVILILLVLAMLIVTASAFASPAQKNKRTVDTGGGWDLSNARVESAGETLQNATGTLVRGYTLVADAYSADNPDFQSGTFRLEMSLFSPAEDMPGQKKNHWYAQGNWTITALEADAEAVTFRHNPYVIEGKLSMEVPGNIAASGRLNNIKAPAQLLIAPAGGGRWLRAEGAFSGNGLFEGRLSVTKDVLYEGE